MVSIEHSVNRGMREGVGVVRSVEQSLYTSNKTRIEKKFGKKFADMWLKKPRGAVKK